MNRGRGPIESNPDKISALQNAQLIEYGLEAHEVIVTSIKEHPGAIGKVSREVIVELADQHMPVQSLDIMDRLYWGMLYTTRHYWMAATSLEDVIKYEVSRKDYYSGVIEDENLGDQEKREEKNRRIERVWSNKSMTWQKTKNRGIRDSLK